MAFPEINVVRKSIRPTTIRVALVYPNSYDAGMSGLGMKLLYHYFNLGEDMYCERVFLNPKEMIPRSLETGTPLRSFDVIAFTMQFELDYINAIRGLLLSEIPPTRESRDQHEQMPLILAGGPAVTANPGPIEPFVDAIFIGDAEPAFPQAFEVLRTNNRKDALHALSTLPGFYVPECEQGRIRKVNQKDLNAVNFPLAQVRPNDEEKAAMDSTKAFFLQITRGCSRGCTFCLIGKMWSPKRNRSLEVLKQLAAKGTEATQTDRISLIGSSTSDHRDLVELLSYFNERKFRFVLPSMRADSSQDILNQVVISGQHQVTIAPESPTESVRAFIKKKLNDDKIFDFMNRAESSGLKKLKMYFMLGLPFPSKIQINDEFENLERFLQKASDHFPFKRQTVATTPFIPKAHTQLQDTLVDYQNVSKLTNRIEKRLRKMGVKYRAFPTNWAIVQAMISIGDKQIGDLMLQVARRGGALNAWRSQVGKLTTAYESLHERIFCLDELPWSRIDFR